MPEFSPSELPNLIDLDPGEVEQVRLALDTIIEQAIQAKRFLDEREFNTVAMVISIIEHNATATDNAVRSKIDPKKAMKAMSHIFAKMADDMEDGDRPADVTDADVDDVMAGLTKLLEGEDTPPAEAEEGT